MPDISELIEETEDLEIPIGRNHMVNVTYRVVGGFNSDDELAVNAALEAGDNEAVTEAWAEQICATVVDWDLADHGEKIPLTTEAVRKIGTPLLQKIQKAIREDRDPKNPATSGNGRSNGTGTSSSGWKEKYNRRGRR